MADFDTYPELDDQLANLGDPEAAESSGTFVIDSLDAANWAVRKISLHAARLAEAEAFAARERDRLSLWLGGVRDEVERSTSFLAGLLRRYHEAKLAEQGIDVRSVTKDEWEKARGKTLRLPAGSVVARRSPPEWDIDAEAFVPWAETNRPDLIRRPDPEPKRVDIKAALSPVGLAPDAGSVPATTADGEVVPGVWVTDGELSFTVKPKVDER